MDTLHSLTLGLSNVIWGWPDVIPLLVVILLATGFITTFYLGWIQIRKFKHGIDVIRGWYDNPDDEGDINHFQALSTALSATVGIGNIAGVATAIHYGGPGALFWMWVTAVFGMALKYAECTLSMRYRVIHEDGSASGGPMYYIEKGLGRSWKPMAIFFAVCAVISSFGSGNAVQAFTMADQLRADLGIQTWMVGLINATIIGLVILGGIRRIGNVTSRLTPIMAVVYVAGGLLVLILNADKVPAIVGMIIASAFKPAAQVGGFAGGAFIFMLTWGVKRGLFSNESGQGSAPIAHAAAKTREPVREGVVAMVGPFVDTLVVCSITGLVILTTGVWCDQKPDRIPIQPQSAITVIVPGAAVGPNGALVEQEMVTGQLSCEGGCVEDCCFVRNHCIVGDARIVLDDGTDYQGPVPVRDGTIDYGRLPSVWLDGRMAQNGSPLTSWAFQRGLSPIGNWGYLIVTLGVFLFGISTAISWSYYGDRSIVYLVGQRGAIPYKVVFLVMHFLGAIFSLEIVWGFGDCALGLMALPNLIAIFFLLPKIREMTRDYFSREHKRYK
ncbi:MAG: sodium:alanine symporter family protein [Candidatus Eisenbacteria sp.]|nr:sodium:alanine symporter family protein [Candidatus Eisenbacteria bacterium]